MADGFTLDIDADLADLIERRAKEAGAAPELIARQAIVQALFRYEDYGWIGDDPRTTPHTSEDEEGARPWGEALSELQAHLARRLAGKA